MTNPEEGSDSAAPKTNQVQEKEKIDETGVSKDGDAKKAVIPTKVEVIR